MNVGGAEAAQCGGRFGWHTGRRWWQVGLGQARSMGESRWNRTASQSREAGGARRTGHTGRHTRDRAGHAMELEGRGDGVKKVGQAVASVSRGKHGLPVASQPSSVPPRPSVCPPLSQRFLETSIKEEIKRFCRRLVHR